MRQFLVVLRGAPASGKSTIAKEFRDLSKKVAWLKVDNFKDFFSEDGSAALEYVNGSAVASLEYLLEQGFSVVMEGVFQDTKPIDEAIMLAKEKNIRAEVFQIQCSLSVLQRRDKERPGVKEGVRKILGDDLIAEIYQKLFQNPYAHANVLDTEKQDIAVCLKQINGVLNLNQP